MAFTQNYMNMYEIGYYNTLVDDVWIMGNHYTFYLLQMKHE